MVAEATAFSSAVTSTVLYPGSYLCSTLVSVSGTSGFMGCESVWLGDSFHSNSYRYPGGADIAT